MCRADGGSIRTVPATTRQLKLAAPAMLAALLLGACANAPKIGDAFTIADAKQDDKADPSKPPQTELERAIEYWGKEHAKNPRDLKPALNYAKNLKAAGQKELALGVLQSASTYHGANRDLASEYGRLALEMGQSSLAQQLLAAADDPAKPDWKIISARGAALAKQGQFKQAIPMFERALELSPNQPSVVSNLAMAHAANGEAPRAEAMLRKASETPGSDPKVRQNLSLVLSLQGKYDEARAISAKDIPQDNAAANVEYVRQMVRVEPQAAPKGTPAVADPNALRGPTTEANAAGGGWSTSVKTASITKAASPSSDGLKPSQR
jgi:Flp pilus assembly protein TadD